MANAALVLCGVLLARARTLNGRWEVSEGDRRRSKVEDVHLHGSLTKLLESTEQALGEFDVKMGRHECQMQASVEKQVERLEQLVTRAFRDGKLMADVPKSSSTMRPSVFVNSSGRESLTSSLHQSNKCTLQRG